MSKVVEKYLMFNSQYVEEHETVQAAMRSAWVGYASNGRYSYEILNGDTVYDRDAILAYWAKTDWGKQPVCANCRCEIDPKGKSLYCDSCTPSGLVTGA